MGAPSLVRIAQRVATKYVDSIQSFADAPVHLVQPILKKVTSPDQLRLLEEDSPQIIGPDTVELWKFFIRRDIPSGDKNELEPKNPALWHKVYRRLKREDEARRKAAEDQLRQSLGQQAANRQNNQATILHTVLPGYLEKGARREAGATSRTTGQNALSALRKQSTRAVVPRRPVYSSSSSDRPRQPSRPVPRGTVAQAPIHMVNQYTRAQGASSGAPPPRPITTHPLPPPRRAGTRNPFRAAGGSAPRFQQQALSLAVRVEAQTQRAKEVESKKRAAAIRAAQTSPTRVLAREAARPLRAPSPPRSSTTTKATVPDAGPSASPRAATEKAAPAEVAKQQLTPQAVKRKAPNIFMANKKARR
ncbi:hypothetical protein K461DRAFT_268504 [Myriangium duriaei CBS 260.36]|uniref:Elongin-A n=1 Tax=Myriangium duriaei CBS 260.36 TaxID=1168546 RepID=A0A9P4MFM9_9PEZI|nr:hypothetical protein K461DRAFT_268504 [Myriangium duriaei CBS 260.36]